MDKVDLAALVVVQASEDTMAGIIMVAFIPDTAMDSEAAILSTAE